MLYALCFSAEAQQVKKVPRIGLLGVVSASAAEGRIEAFRQGLRDLGYVEGKNIVIEYRTAEGKLELIEYQMSQSNLLNAQTFQAAVLELCSFKTRKSSLWTTM